MSTLKVNQSIRLSNGTTAVVQKEPGRGGQGIYISSFALFRTCPAK